jgi:3',5'-cyclic AMP phosphodiesterase CpdA
MVYNKKMLIIILLLIGILIISGNTISSVRIKNSDVVEDYFHLRPVDISRAIEDNEQIKILYPLSSIPALVEKNDFLHIKFKCFWFDRVYAYISTAYEPVVDEIWLESHSIFKNNSLCEATYYIPDDTPKELYNLTIIIERDGEFYTCSIPRSVSVYDKIDDDFTIVHVADFHVGDPRGFAESLYQTLGFRSIKKCISEINLMHPDLVLISGDLVFGQLYPFEYSYEYRKCYEIIQLFDVPTFLVPGNHDGYYRFKEDGLLFWKQYFGPLYYSFDFGDYHFIGVNSFDWPAKLRSSVLFIALNWGGSIQDMQLKWIEQDLRNTESDLKFIFLHHNPIWDTKTDSLLRMGYKNREEFLSLIYEYDVDMVLAGHVHLDTVNEENETIFITTTTPQSGIRNDDGYWGYRVIEIEDGNIVSFNYKEPKYSVPTYKLNSEYIDVYNRQVSNDLEKDVEVLLKFTVPLGKYIAHNADIIMFRQNNFKQQVYVDAWIPAGSEKMVTLIPVR